MANLDILSAVHATIRGAVTDMERATPGPVHSFDRARSQVILMPCDCMGHKSASMEPGVFGPGIPSGWSPTLHRWVICPTILPDKRDLGKPERLPEHGRNWSPVPTVTFESMGA